MSTNKTLHPKAKHALNAVLASLVIIVSILFAHTKWLMITGIVTGFLLSIISMVLSIKAFQLINKEKESYRGDNMAWIALILGILIFLSCLPFIIEFIGILLK